MPIGIPDYEIQYLNPDGQWVSAFKADLFGASAFMVFGNGDAIPMAYYGWE